MCVPHFQRDILKRVQGTNTQNSANDNSFEHTIKLLLERCASVLFDEDFGQELLTRLVVSMETTTSGSIDNDTSEDHEGLAESRELVKELRILLALSVYHKVC